MQRSWRKVLTKTSCKKKKENVANLKKYLQSSKFRIDKLNKSFKQDIETHKPVFGYFLQKV